MTSTATLDAVFSALADPTRRAILARLSLGEATVGQLRVPFAVSQPAISKHLRVLEEAGLISTHPEGRARPRRLEVGALHHATEYLVDFREFWEASAVRLDALLASLPDPPTAPSNPRKE